uniref:Uncharacterized protein n=1 Tax=Bionectria ochroleuca TaxID=29856 RepID=A0A0B7JNX4_BIOOC
MYVYIPDSEAGPTINLNILGTVPNEKNFGVRSPPSKEGPYLSRRSSGVWGASSDIRRQSVSKEERDSPHKTPKKRNHTLYVVYGVRYRRMFPRKATTFEYDTHQQSANYPVCAGKANGPSSPSLPAYTGALLLFIRGGLP